MKITVEHAAKVLLLSSLSTLLALGIAEISFRAFHEPAAELSPDKIWQSQSRDGHNGPLLPQTQIGDFWFREETPDPKVFEDSYTRILFLGDSFTYGMKIIDASSASPT